MLLIASFLIGVAVTVGLARFIHNYKRQKQMACSCGGSMWKVRKAYQMIPLNIATGQYAFFVFAICPCGKVRLIRSENKRFTAAQIARREEQNPDQFVIKPELFVRSGIVVSCHSGDVTVDDVCAKIRRTFTPVHYEGLVEE